MPVPKRKSFIHLFKGGGGLGRKPRGALHKGGNTQISSKLRRRGKPSREQFGRGGIPARGPIPYPLGKYKELSFLTACFHLIVFHQQNRKTAQEKTFPCAVLFPSNKVGTGFCYSSFTSSSFTTLTTSSRILST